jgi:2-polyprenyl-3-methyl-5-hydroxy-6-metoxy-1,4-benzoquinol methylase
VPDSEAPEDDLQRLINAAMAPPFEGSGGWLRRTVRLALLRIGRARAVHQQRIDQQLMRALERLEHSERDAESRLSEELREQRGWLLETSRRGDEVAGRLEALLGDDNPWSAEWIGRLVASDAPLYGAGSFRLEAFDAGLGGTVVGFRGGEPDQGERLYLGFEDYFRGSEEAIRDRQRAYLPLLGGRGRTLDVGCGRGEFLELMRDAGIEAAGIDIDPSMVEHCRRKGLERVHVADAVSHLETLVDHSLEVIFAAQVIEHLPYPELLRLLRFSREKLAPGGLLVLETVNPHCPQALKQFWIDPTHRHPLFPETVVALCRLTGFAGAYIWHPQGSGDPDKDRVEQPDYAVVAETPAAAT